MQPELRVTPIRHGSVLDHIPAGAAAAVLRVLGLPRPGWASPVSVVMHVPSKAMGRKDIVKLEDRELTPEEEGIVALVAPGATLNLIRGYAVGEKRPLKPPAEVEGHFRCAAPDCITNVDKAPGRFAVRDKHLECGFCGARGEPGQMLA